MKRSQELECNINFVSDVKNSLTNFVFIKIFVLIFIKKFLY